MLEEEKYAPDDKMLERLASSFVFHPVKEDQGERYERIRAGARNFAMLIVHLTPPSREQSLALTALEDVVMRANQSIALNE